MCRDIEATRSADVIKTGISWKPTRRPDTAGEFDAADAFFTFPTGITPPYGSRFVLPISQPIVHDRLLKGSEDVFRYAHVLAVLGGHYIRRVARSGISPTQYDNVRVNVVEGTDFSVNLTTRRVSWIGSAIPAGTRVVFRLKTYAEFVCCETRDRNEGGQEMPWSILCRRMDFLIHPRGPHPVSY